mmetsp:Transcript_39189/g.92252  ORF Transcript_39189/g.92252 Transcript_39189/m.92252 type:complete len:428 (-) Transcript_39189:136-1419(-)|eukprot:CAMPEP_0178421436 /NCGR_PEP_ID=MMETSP0689_2-20121128/26645_1 /TAXON_ID=160604 /ORGANISM="Amphidinium massartii, Strain CS-259" /LENGTH=427 /DNA_ID=CAMNT_0020042945 /DNA_START=14 /DNA_END=1297 /DNA_ORIENTATION=+
MPPKRATLGLALGVLCSLPSSLVADVAEQPPLIFMGGLGASMMRAKLNRSSVPHSFCTKQDDDYKLWLYYENLLPLKADCWLDNMRLRWHDGELQDEVQIHLVGDDPNTKGISAGFSKSNLWSDLLNSVADLGYGDDSPHVHALHYDWRLSVVQLASDGTFSRLRTQIETAVEKASGKAAILVTLSYAGPIMHSFLTGFVDAAWKKKHIARWVSLSGTFGGSSELVRIAFYPEGSDFFNVPSILPYISLKDARAMSNTFASTFASWPKFLNKDEVLINVTAEDGAVKLYTADETSQALKDSGLEQAEKVYARHKDAYSFHELPSPDVDVDCVYGVGDSTVSSLQFGKGFNTPATGYGYEDGDGVATSRSLRMCGEWRSKGNHGTLVRTHEIQHAGHGGPLHHHEAVAVFGKIVHGIVAAFHPVQIQV